MTDVVSHPAFPAGNASVAADASRQAVWRTSPWQPALLVLVGAAVAAGWLAAGLNAAQPSLLEGDAELATLLRFMAAVKAVIALAVLGVTAWRLGHPATPAIALLYLASVSLMAAAPGVIWQLAHVGVGAGLFHAGLLLFLGALVADRGGASQLVGTALQRARCA
jgi:hypothetical protein